MSFEFKTKSNDFFDALRPLVPKAIEIAHICYEQVLIKDGRIKEGEYDKTQGLTGLFVSELDISQKGSGFKLEGRAFGSTPQIEDLDRAVNAIQDYLSILGLYNPVPFPDECLEARIVIETMFFSPGAFSILMHVSRSMDGEYYGDIIVSYEVIVSDVEDAKSHLTETALIRNQKYEELFRIVQKAESNDEKKVALENFVSLLVKDLPGFEVRYIDKRGIDNEIDIYVVNESQDNFLMQLSNPVLIECRNWSQPMPANAIRDFAGKLRDKSVNTGIIVSIKGVTGTEHTAAKASIRTFLSRDKIKIIVFDEKDLEKVVEGESFRSLLRDKYYELMTY